MMERCLLCSKPDHSGPCYTDWDFGGPKSFLAADALFRDRLPSGRGSLIVVDDPVIRELSPDEAKSLMGWYTKTLEKMKKKV